MERKTRNKPNTDQPQLQINSLYQRGTDATTNNRKTNIIIAPTSGGKRVVSRQRSFHNFATFVKISKRICKFSMEFKRSGVEFAEISRGPCCETHDATNFPSTLTLSLSFSLSPFAQRVTPPTFCPAVRIRGHNTIWLGTGLGKTIVSTCNPGPCFNLKEPWYAADCIA